MRRSYDSNNGCDKTNFENLNGYNLLIKVDRYVATPALPKNDF